MGMVVHQNVSQCLTLAGVARKRGRRPEECDLGLIENAAIALDTDSGTVEWVGPQNELPARYRSAAETIDGSGWIVMPALVECHTHLIHAGDRSRDYSLRAAGLTYQQVARAGGGILSTLAHTRAASPDALFERALVDIARFEKDGVGCIEIKTGYGLSLESEIRILECVARLRSRVSARLVATFMPAHATPPEFEGRTQAYVDTICREWIPAVSSRKLAEFFDVFIEEGYFSLAQGAQLCEAARSHGLGIKIHGEQFHELGSATLGADLGATSVDHLDHLSENGITRLAASETVAVLLPGASLYTGTPFPPARALINAGARVALSTDYNPGTCPSRNLPLMTTLACSQMRMTVPEALAAVTYNAAAALGLEDRMGSLEPGKSSSLCRFRAGSYHRLTYCFGEMETT